MVSGGPASEAIYVAIVLAQAAELRAREEAHPEFVYERRELLLPEQLHVWRKVNSPRLAYQKMPPLLGDPLVAAADRYGLARPRRPGWHSIYRWVTEFYKIEGA
jgi:hypothetical protein